MKSSDFKELQEFCEQKGYQLLNESLEDNTKFFVVAKKVDEFIIPFPGCYLSPICTNKIYKVVKSGKKWVDVINGSGENVRILSGYFKPSAESAYIEQLKAEAFKRFGNMNKGDEFIPANPNEGRNKICFIMGGFQYEKDLDRLWYLGVVLYEQGKWATKLPKRVKVEFVSPTDIDANFSHGRFMLKPRLVVSGMDFKSFDKFKACEFMSSCLESYLNGETPNPPIHE